MRCVGWAVWLVSAWVAAAAAGSCREAKLCCPGRDSSCVVQKAPLNAIIEDLNDKPCYCDHACLKLGDCCSDFKDACGVVDCAVTPWGPWAPCDAECGAGTTTRARSVERQPENGGRHCPALTQRRGCQGTGCSHAAKAQLKETAMLLPARLAASRRVNETTDIRRNLRLRYPKDPKQRTEYCVSFEVLKVSKACRKENAYSALREGARVCVRCEAAALRRALGWRCAGAGLEARASRWSALPAPHCHGKWLRLPSRAAGDDSAQQPRAQPRAQTHAQTHAQPHAQPHGDACQEACGAEDAQFIFV